MKTVNLKDIEEKKRQSPKGKFGRASKDISVALGRDPESLDLMKRHPFDVALVRVAPDQTICPYHSHSCETEFYLVVSGRGAIRDKNGITEVEAGDAFFFGPGEAHQLSNRGKDDFVYYVIADNPRGDTCFYPDSGKFIGLKEGGEEVVVKGAETDYFDGEE